MRISTYRDVEYSSIRPPGCPIPANQNAFHRPSPNLSTRGLRLHAGRVAPPPPSFVPIAPNAHSPSSAPASASLAPHTEQKTAGDHALIKIIRNWWRHRPSSPHHQFLMILTDYPGADSGGCNPGQGNRRCVRAAMPGGAMEPLPSSLPASTRQINSRGTSTRIRVQPAAIGAGGSALAECTIDPSIPAQFGRSTS